MRSLWPSALFWLSAGPDTSTTSLAKTVGRTSVCAILPPFRRQRSRTEGGGTDLWATTGRPTISP